MESKEVRIKYEPIVQNLHKIFDLGDRDEMSYKHLGHGIAGILAFDNWEEAIDYTYPSDYTEWEGNADRIAKLDRLWSEIHFTIDEMGYQEFVDDIGYLSTFFAFWYVGQYYAQSWLPYRKAIEEKGILIKGEE